LLLLLAFALFHHRLHQIYNKVLVFTARYFSSQFLQAPPTCLFFNLHWSGLPLSVRAARTCPVFPRVKTCPFCPRLRTCPNLVVCSCLSDLSVFPKAEDLSDFQVWDIGQVTVSNFDWLPFTPLWSPSPVLQLVSEPVWSPVSFNRLCDLKATWRKVLLSLWSSMAKISVTEKTELATIF
jgi:hypothetical protein